jgi:hypothetical protein
MIMKRYRLTGFAAAMLAVVAFSAMAVASSASGVTFLLAFFLVNAQNLTVTALAVWSLPLLFRNSGAPGGPAVVSCSVTRDGFVGPNSADDITEYLTLSGTSVSMTALTGTALSCELVELCENSSKAWAVNLPWLSELELWEEGTQRSFVDLTLPHTGGGNPGWYVECKTALLTVSEECTSPELVAEDVNVVEGTEEILSEAFTLLMEAKDALCSSNNEETGSEEGKGIETTVEGGTPLSASST